MLASDDYARVYLRREKAWYILSRDACRDLLKFSLETRPSPSSTRACYNYAWEYFRRQEPRRAASQQISAPLVERIINQDHHLDDCHLVQQSIKRRIQQTKHTKQKEAAKSLQSLLPAPLQRSMELAQEKGASTWLTALPIEEHGFALHKAAFKDSLSLRYVWPLQNSPSHCSCGQPYSVEHALNCKTGGFPTVRHNEVRDITATLLTEVCHGVTIEPYLQPLSGESLSHRSAITEDGARLKLQG